MFKSDESDTKITNAGFDMCDAQVKANNMTDHLLDGTELGLSRLRGEIAREIMAAYKLGQQSKQRNS